MDKVLKNILTNAISSMGTDKTTDAIYELLSDVYRPHAVEGITFELHKRSKAANRKANKTPQETS